PYVDAASSGSAPSRSCCVRELLVGKLLSEPMDDGFPLAVLRQGCRPHLRASLDFRRLTISLALQHLVRIEHPRRTQEIFQPQVAHGLVQGGSVEPHSRDALVDAFAHLCAGDAEVELSRQCRAELPTDWPEHGSSLELRQQNVSNIVRGGGSRHLGKLP